MAEPTADADEPADYEALGGEVEDYGLLTLSKRAMQFWDNSIDDDDAV